MVDVMAGVKQQRIRWRRAIRNHRTELQEKRGMLKAHRRLRAKSGHRYVDGLIWP